MIFPDALRARAVQFHAPTIFDSVWQVASRYSGMDQFRMFQLWHMAHESAKLHHGDLLEVGCAKGGSGLMIAASARLSGIRESIHLCDTFSGLVKSDPAVDVHRDGAMGDTDARSVIELFARHGISSVHVVTGVFPESCGHLDGTTFRFVHLDVDIYRSAQDALKWIWPRVITGGIIVIDDYGEDDCPGITKLVDDMIEHPGAMWFMHGGLQAIAVKLA